MEMNPQLGQVMPQLMDAVTKGKMGDLLKQMPQDQLEQLVLKCANGDQQMAQKVMQQLQAMADPRMSKAMSQQAMAQYAAWRK